MKVYHKSSCITCKNGINEVQRISKDIESRDFFKDPLSESELSMIFKMTEKKPSECLRKRDKMYKELELENSQKTEKEIIKLMIKNPGLILRPIVISKKKAYFGKINKETINRL